MAAEDRGPQVAAVAILFLTLSWIFVSLRCYVRAIMMKNFGTDDWLAVATLVRYLLGSCLPCPIRLCLANFEFLDFVYTLLYLRSERGPIWVNLPYLRQLTFTDWNLAGLGSTLTTCHSKTSPLP